MIPEECATFVNTKEKMKSKMDVTGKKLRGCCRQRITVILVGIFRAKLPCN